MKIEDLISFDVSRLVKCIENAATDGVMQDMLMANLDRQTMNSLPTRSWDLINRDVKAELYSNPDVSVGFTRRNAWNVLAFFDKNTGVLFTLMRKERLKALSKSPTLRSHYVPQLSSSFNGDLPIYQQTLFNNECDDFTKKSVERICHDLFISPEMVKNYAIILFSSDPDMFHSIDCVMVNRNFEICETIPLSGFVTAGESIVVEQVDDDLKNNNSTLGLKYTEKARRKRGTNKTLDYNQSGEEEQKQS